MKYGYNVEINQTLVSEEYSNEEFGPWSQIYYNEFFKVSKSTEYPDIVSDIDLQVGKKCYIVWVEWSSGNSFGWADNQSVEAIGIFKDKKSADELVKALEQYVPDESKDWDERYKLNYKTSDGQEFNFGFVPWSGYFEHLEEVHCEETIIE